MAERHSIISSVDRDAFAGWLSGFTDGEGCFQLQHTKGYGGRYPSARFDLAVRRDDSDIVRDIRDFLGVGYFVQDVNAGRDMARFRVTKTADLVDVIVPHFDAYPMFAKKRLDYAVWREAVLLIAKARVRRGKPRDAAKWTAADLAAFERLYEAQRSHKRLAVDAGTPIVATSLHQQREFFGRWLAGFADAEGCFWAGMQGKGRGCPSVGFAIGLRGDDGPVLEAIRDHLGVGRIHSVEQVAKSGNVTRKSVYSVYSVADLVASVVPAFEAYPLRAKKKSDFALWKSAVALCQEVQRRPVVAKPRDKGRYTGAWRRWTDAELAEYRGLARQLRAGRHYVHTGEWGERTPA